jgi:hypothetical protein
MKSLHRVVAVCAAVALLVCARARAQQVLDQVPSDAVGVLEVKNLQDMSTKVAKLAKSLGVDQFVPQFADPLGAMMDEYGLKQGVNKNGDMAIAFFAPRQGAGARAGGADDADADNKDAGAKKDNPPAVVLIAIDDYKGFLGNFNDVKDAGGGVSEVHVPKNSEKLFVVNHGKYAVAAMDKALLSKPAGLKLQGAIGKEARAKDALLYIDVKSLRPMIQQGIKQGRQEFDKAAKDPDAQKNNPFGQQMTPQLKAIIEQYIKAAEQITNDTRSAAISFNISDTGIGAAGMADFEADSSMGRLVAKVQNTDKPLLAGLPQRTYFAFGGMSITPEVMQQLMTDFLDPLAKQLAGPNGQDALKGFDSLKQAVTSMKDVSFGYVYPGGAPGESMVQAVGIAHGDANKILSGQKQALPAMNTLMGMGGKSKAEINVSPEPKTVEGVQLTQYSIKFNFDQNDPQAMREQQAISMMYGRNGINGVMAAPDNNTFVSVQGGNDKLIADTLASAKANQDTLSGMANVKAVAGQLPKQRSMEFYFALDNVVNAGLRFAKQNGIPVNVKIPANLPPIGFSGGTEQSTARFEMVVPTQLIQSLTAAGMQAWMQMNQGPGAGGQGGGV